MIDAALTYAKSGFAIFPCAKKKPLTGKGGFHNATSNELKVRQWWTEHPHAQIGLPTGKKNHLFVVDIDSETAASQIAKMNLPVTRTIETQPGHWQLWFRQPEGVETHNSAGVIGPEIDTRGDGGYIIAPPSIHHETGKPYRVVRDIPLADAPLEVLTRNAVNGNGHSESCQDMIPKGKRHWTMLSIAGALRARGFSRSAVLRQLQIANQLQCAPQLEDSELEKLADYVGEKLAGYPGRQVAPKETTAEVEIESLAGVTPERVRWLWNKRIALGKLTIFAGDPGKGKSLVTVDIASCVTRGALFPDGTPGEVGDILFLSAEDDAADTLVPRLIASGANLSRLHRVKAVRVTLADGTTGESTFNFDRDIEKLDEALSKIPNTRALIVDPVSAYMGKIDTHRDSDVRRILAPLSDLASRRRVAVIGVMHLKKSETSALLRVSGSIGFVAAARCVWGFGEDPENPENRVMIGVKNNLAPLGSGLSYRIEAKDDVPRIVWQGAVTRRADDVLAGDPRERRKHGERKQDAEEWLLAMLENGEERLVSEIMAEAKKSQVGWRTIEAIKKECGVRAVKRGRQWYWVLA